MNNETIYIKNEQMLTTKKILGGVSALNATCFGIYAAMGAVNGQHTLLVASFLLCMANICFVMYSYTKHRGEYSYTKHRRENRYTKHRGENR